MSATTRPRVRVSCRRQEQATVSGRYPSWSAAVRTRRAIYKLAMHRQGARDRGCRQPGEAGDVVQGGALGMHGSAPRLSPAGCEAARNTCYGSARMRQTLPLTEELLWSGKFARWMTRSSWSPERVQEWAARRRGLRRGRGKGRRDGASCRPPGGARIRAGRGPGRRFRQRRASRHQRGRRAKRPRALRPAQFPQWWFFFFFWCTWFSSCCCAFLRTPWAVSPAKPRFSPRPPAGPR